MKRSRHTFLIGWLMVGTMILLWVDTSRVLAHAVIVSTLPKPNSVVTTPPTEVWIQFSEPIEPAFSSITVLSQAGQALDTGDLTADNEDNTAFVVQR